MLDTALSLALDRGDQLRTPPVVIAACTGVLQKIRAESPGMRSIGVTSALSGEGCSTIAAGLAVANASHFGGRTVLVDLDIGCDSLAAPPRERADHPESLGIARAIEWITADLGVLPRARWSPSRGAARALVDALLQELAGLDVLAIADLPPLPPHGCGDRFARSCDEVVQVVRAGSTDVAVARAAAAVLDTPPFVVLNQVHSSVPRWLPGLGSR